MPEVNWQLLVCGVAVAAAAAVLVRGFVRLIRGGSTGCGSGGCGDCPSAQTDSASPSGFVSLQSLETPAANRDR